MSDAALRWFWLLLALLPYGLLESRTLAALRSLPAKMGYQPGGEAGWKAYIRRRSAASVLGGLCWALGVLALSGAVRFPRYASEPVLGAELVFVMDASNSMLTDDGRGSRLEDARAFASRVASAADGAALSLVAFRGGAVTLCPSTLDRRAFEDALRWAGPAVTTTMGSDLGVAIEEALRPVPPAGTVRVLVVLGDGNDTGDTARAASVQASEAGVQSVFVGFGGDSPQLVVDPAGVTVLDGDGKPVYTVLKESVLRELAHAANGEFVRADDPEAYSLVATVVREASASTGKRRTVKVETDAGPLLAWVALATLGGAVVLSFAPAVRKSRRVQYDRRKADA